MSGIDRPDERRTDPADEPARFDLAESEALLRRTPSVLRAWLEGLPEAWVAAREGPDGWSAYDIVGHLIHGEKTDWIPRLEQILSGDAEEPFEPFDRTAMFRETAGRSIAELLAEFATLRERNLERLASFRLSADDYDRPGLHPELGPVDLRQLVATWVAHDLSHIGQIARVMAKRYREEVGPWRAYLPLLDR